MQDTNVSPTRSISAYQDPMDKNCLPNTITTSQMWLFKFKWINIQYNEKFSSLVTLATSQFLGSHTWLVATVLDRRAIKHSVITVLVNSTDLEEGAGQRTTPWAGGVEGSQWTTLLAQHIYRDCVLFSPHSTFPWSKTVSLLLAHISISKWIDTLYYLL